MKYPNAADGVKKIYMSEIISIIASAVTIVVYTLFFFYEENSVVIGLSVAMLAIVVIYLAAYILQIVGIVRASKDEPAFKVSLYAIVAASIITVLGGVFYENETIHFVISVAGDVAQFFLVHYIIHGIMHLSDHLGRPEISKKGKFIFRVIYIAIIFEIIVRIFELIYGRERGESLAMPFSIIAEVLKTVEYILFLIYIGKGSRMLNKAKQSSDDTAE